jgi:histone H3/H4
MFVKKSYVKEYVKEKHGLRTSADSIEILSEVVEVILDNAAKNAKADKRATIKPRDITEVQ